MDNYPVIELIPQRPPFVMVDEFVGMEGAVSRTRFTIPQDNPLVSQGCFSECGIIEHIAQSAAARVGFLFREQGEDIPLGYIGSVNDFTLVRLPRIGELIETGIRVVQELFNITLIEAECRVDGSMIASCRMKIFLDRHEA